MQGRCWCGQDSQGLTLFRAVSRTSKTRGGTSSGSWQKRVCFPLVDHSPFIPGNLFFVDPLHSLPDVHSCLQFAAPGEDVVAFIGPREARPSAGRSSEHQWISFTTFDRAHPLHCFTTRLLPNLHSSRCASFITVDFAYVTLRP